MLYAGVVDSFSTLKCLIGIAQFFRLQEAHVNCYRALAIILFVATSMWVEPISASKMSGNYALPGRPDPFDCRAKVRRELGAAPGMGPAYKGFWGRVRGCIAANGGTPNVASRTVSAESTRSKPQTPREHVDEQKAANTKRAHLESPGSRPATVDLSIQTPEQGPDLIGRRVALVMGNGDYVHVPKLTNPPNDAAAVAAALRRLSFSVTILNDASADTIRSAITELENAATDADIVTVYYAGHGLEGQGENWIIPIDASFSESQIDPKTSVNLKTIMTAVSKAKTLGLVILDACRNAPLLLTNNAGASADAPSATAGRRTRSVGRGLAPVSPTGGNVLVAFAAKDGSTAEDGNGRHSPFTAALLHYIEEPGLEVSNIFRNVRDEVMSSSHGEQQPFVYGSLSKRDVFLKEKNAR